MYPCHVIPTLFSYSITVRGTSIVVTSRSWWGSGVTHSPPPSRQIISSIEKSLSTPKTVSLCRERLCTGPYLSNSHPPFLWNWRKSREHDERMIQRVTGLGCPSVPRFFGSITSSRQVYVRGPRVSSHLIPSLSVVRLLLYIYIYRDI